MVAPVSKADVLNVLHNFGSHPKLRQIIESPIFKHALQQAGKNAKPPAKYADLYLYFYYVDREALNVQVRSAANQIVDSSGSNFDAEMAKVVQAASAWIGAVRALPQNTHQAIQAQHRWFIERGS